MEVTAEDKVTVQGLNNPVPAAEQGDQAGPLSSLSSDRNVTEVVNLASVADNATSSNDEEEEEDEGPEPIDDDAAMDLELEVSKICATVKRKRLTGKQRRAVAVLKKDRQRYSVEEYTKAYKLLTRGRSPPLEHLQLGTEQANGSKALKKIAPAADNLSQETGKRAGSTLEYSFLKKRRLDADEPVPTVVPGLSLNEDLTWAIIDENNACGLIPRPKRLPLVEAINEELARFILEADECDPTIQIESIQYFRDDLMVQVASIDCIDTLKTLIERMPAPWKDAKLRLVSMAAMLAQTKMKFSVKGVASKLTSEEILKIIRGQNTDLPVGRWEVFRREDTENESRLIVGLDHVSMSSLAKTQGRVFFLGSTLTLTLGKVAWRKSPANTSSGGSAQ